MSPATTTFVRVSRVSGAGPSGFVGDFVETPLATWTVKPGDYVAVEVDKWALRHRNRHQTPVLLGKGWDFSLTAVRGGQPAPEPELTAASYPAWLLEGWKLRDEALAQSAAAYLEEFVYPELTRTLDYRPSGKTLIEIFNRAKNTDGHGWFSARMVGLPYIGTVAACTVLIPRILGITLILNASLAPNAALGLGPIFLAGVVLILLAWRSLRGGEPKSEPPEPRNPLQLRSAIQMVVAFQAVLTLLTLITRQFGEPGVLASATVLGISDMDALTFGMNRLAETSGFLNLAARAITLGVTVNSVFKGILALALGAPRYRLLVGLAMLAQAVAGAVGFWLLTLGAGR